MSRRPTGVAFVLMGFVSCPSLFSSFSLCSRSLSLYQVIWDGLKCDDDWHRCSRINKRLLFCLSLSHSILSFPPNSFRIVPSSRHSSTVWSENELCIPLKPCLFHSIDFLLSFFIAAVTLLSLWLQGCLPPRLYLKCRIKRINNSDPISSLSPSMVTSSTPTLESTPSKTDSSGLVLFHFRSGRRPSNIESREKRRRTSAASGVQLHQL